jgi:molybdate-binding protein
MDEAREKQAFDVFLSHNSQDKPAVRALIKKCSYARRKEELEDTEEAAEKQA